jgi:hypothetical protein
MPLETSCAVEVRTLHLKFDLINLVYYFRLLHFFLSLFVLVALCL